MTDFAYVPRDSAVTLRAPNGGRFALPAARASRRLPFRYGPAEQVAVEQDELMRLILEAKTPVVTIVGKTWLLHVTEVLRAKPDENLAMIGDTIRYLKDNGKTVIYDAEHSFDGYADEPEYALATWLAAEKARVNLSVDLARGRDSTSLYVYVKESY